MGETRAATRTAELVHVARQLRQPAEGSRVPTHHARAARMRKQPSPANPKVSGLTLVAGARRKNRPSERRARLPRTFA